MKLPNKASLPTRCRRGLEIVMNARKLQPRVRRSLPVAGGRTLTFCDKMKPHSIIKRIVIIVLATALHSEGADEPKPIDPFAVVDPATEKPKRPWNPNHLEPVPAYDTDGYDQAVFRSLIGDRPGELWMIGKPSFKPEYAVILRNHIEYEEGGDPLDRKKKSEKWIIEYVETKKKIWQWQEIDKRHMKLDIHVTKDVKRKGVEVTDSFAEVLKKTWLNVLEQTKYTKMPYRGLDGATFQFYCHYNLFGEIWTPRSGIPSMITDLGHKLVKLANSNLSERESLIAECVSLAKKINAETKSAKQD